MKRKFFITEVACYQVGAETAGKAMDAYLNHPDSNRLLLEITEQEIESEKPNPVKVGAQIHVDAHESHDEDFSGVVVENDYRINGRIKAKAPDGETYDCAAEYVYVPSPNETKQDLRLTDGIRTDPDPETFSRADGERGP